MKIAIVTDSTAFLPKRIRKHRDLSIIPIPVILDGKIYNEDVDIKADDYYELLKQSKEFPTTSQPSIGEVLTLYQSLADKGYEAIISIHLSAGISGFVKNLETIKDSIDDVKIIPYDSKITSMPMGHMVETALDMVNQNRTTEEILDRLDMIREKTYAYLVVNDLQNLVRGGRLTNGAALIGGLLKIKPILDFEEGKIVLFERIRSSKKAFKRVEEVIGERVKENPAPVIIYVIHGNNLEVAEEEKKRLQKKFPGTTIEIGHFGPVIGTHLGEKAVGIAITTL